MVRVALDRFKLLVVGRLGVPLDALGRRVHDEIGANALHQVDGVPWQLFEVVVAQLEHRRAVVHVQAAQNLQQLVAIVRSSFQILNKNKAKKLRF